MRGLQGVAIAGAAVVGATVGVAAASAGVSAYLARLSVTVDRGLERPVSVLRVVPGDVPLVWLTGEGSRARGQHSLLFDPPGAPPGDGVGAQPTGHARLGPVIRRNGADVLRAVRAVDSGDLVAGARGRMVGWWYTNPEELGYRVEETTYETELGPMTAWIVHPKRPRKKRWAIHMHGRGASPAETFRGIEPFAHAGVTSMIITYRNDLGAPAGLHGRYGMGVSESRDLDAAITEARARGAERVTLMGWSMGGTASLVSVARGEHCDVIDGLILESPGADWAQILRDKAAQVKLPGWIADAGMALLARGLVPSGEAAGIDFECLAPERLAASLDVPTLILASPDDRFVPWRGSQVIAEARPDLVELVSIPGAGHVRLWNVDPELWESTVLRFVAALPRPGWRGQ